MAISIRGITIRKNFIAWLLAGLLFSRCNSNKPSNEGPATTTGTTIHSNADPLRSWNEGPVKQAIITYVKNVTDSTSRQFIPVIDRIATFDNDGTLWAEQPLVEKLFVYYMVKKLVAKDPGLAKKQPFKAVVEGDTAYLAKGGNIIFKQLAGGALTGITEDEFELFKKDFFTTARYPGRDVPLSEIVYEPQLELLSYLRANGFNVFMCTGGSIEYVRGISQQLYGIPKYQVIGTTFKYKFSDSTRTIIREPELDLSDNKEGKPVGIEIHIGQRPVFACGNVGGEGDIPMLKFCQGNKYASFQMLINHDDSTREFYYQEKTNASLNAAQKNNWHVVSMKNDWKMIFSKR